MALNKLITQRNGVTTEYHRVQNIEITNLGDNASLMIMLQSFIDESYREKGLSNAVARRVYDFEVSNDVVTSNNIYQVAYGLIKTLPDFEDATDV